MKMPMKLLDYQLLLKLNENSMKAGRSQQWNGKKDIRCSVILEPGIRTVWLDVSPEEFDSIKTVEMPELDWEAAVCVGIPAWVK
jgi:hypothetical protein